MSTLNVMWANYWTTLVGAALAGLYYLDQIGTKLPSSGGEWLHVCVGLGLAVLGFVAKSATVGSVPPSVKVLACALLLGGCGTFAKAQADIAQVVGAVQLDLSKATAADVDMAIEMAKVATDPGAPYRLRCYTTLRKYVMTSPAVSTPPIYVKGVVSAYEQAVELDLLARQGLSAIPMDVHFDCAGEIVNLQEFALRVGLKFAPLPGAAAVGGVLR